jgi:DNA modification methylase
LLWELGGEHLVWCGDSLNYGPDGETEEVMVVTDPPYGVDMGRVIKEKLRSQHNRTGKLKDCKCNDFEYNRQVFADKEVPNLSVVYRRWDPRVVYCFAASSRLPEFYAHFESAQIVFRSLLVWAKTHPSFGWSHYKYKHEPLLYGTKKGMTAKWVGGHKQTTILTHPSIFGKKRIHCCQKPVELLMTLIGNHDIKTVVDPFMGSGSCLIAADKCGRRFIGGDLDRRHVDNAIAWWVREREAAGKDSSIVCLEQ